jgi:hypothetical protein
MGNANRHEQVQRLFANLRRALPEMERLLHEVTLQSSREICRLQAITAKVVETLHALAPELPINSRVASKVAVGTGAVRSLNDASWIDAARPVVDAFLEAKFFLESGIQCAKKAGDPSQAEPAELAVLLRFYNLR